MTRKNRYNIRSHISETKFRQIVRYFCHDFTSSMTAELTGISRPTINKIYQKIRVRVAAMCEAESPLSGEIEVDAKNVSAAKGAELLAIKRLSLAYLKGEEKSTQKSYQTLKS